jgi:hypothetical protein
MNSAVETNESQRPIETERSHDLVSELLILPDGRVLVHSLTPTFAALLSELNPACEQISSRITSTLRSAATEDGHHASRLNELPN